jgi:hypothetical protein
MKTTIVEVNTENLNKVFEDIAEIKEILCGKKPMSDWLNWQQAMDFLGYKETSMRALEKEGKLKFKMIGRRKFIKRQDLENFIEQL